MFEARSLVFEFSGVSIDKQMQIPMSKWMMMHEVSIKRYEQKLKLMALSR